MARKRAGDIYGKVLTRFWDDADIRALSHRDQRILLYLFTNRHRNIAGCYRLPITYAAEDLRLDVADVQRAFSENLAPWAVWDGSTQEIWVRNLAAVNLEVDRTAILEERQLKDKRLSSLRVALLNVQSDTLLNAWLNWYSSWGLKPERLPVTNYQRYQGSGWEKVREAAFVRDNYTCQHCSSTDRTTLEGHHIRQRMTFEDPKDADTVENTLTLCIPCHRKEDGRLRRLTDTTQAPYQAPPQGVVPKTEPDAGSPFEANSSSSSNSNSSSKRTTHHLTARAIALLDRFSQTGGDRWAVTDWLEALPKNQNLDAWVGRFSNWLDGVGFEGGIKASPSGIAMACRDWDAVDKNKSYAPRLFRKCVLKAMQDEKPTVGGNTRDAATLATVRRYEEAV